MRGQRMPRTSKSVQASEASARPGFAMASHLTAQVCAGIWFLGVRDKRGVNG